MARGIKTSGKAAYLFAILPYIILTTILIVALTLDGAWDGIKYFIVPEDPNSGTGSSAWLNLFDLKVW